MLLYWSVGWCISVHISTQCSYKRIVKSLFTKCFQNSRCIFEETRILNFGQFYNLNEASYMYNILNQGKYPTLRASLCISYPSHNYVTRNNNEMFLLFPRVEAIRMNFKYQYVKVWLEMPEFIKSQRTFLQLKNAVPEFSLAHY